MQAKCRECAEPVFASRLCYYHFKRAKGLIGDIDIERKVCSRSDCSNTAKSHGLCSKHRLEERGGLTDDDPRHGTYTGYKYWGCRCDPCRIGYRNKLGMKSKP